MSNEIKDLSTQTYSPTPVHIVPAKTDFETAEGLKKELIETMVPVCAILNKAKDLGFEINYGVGPNFLGKIDIMQLKIAKLF